MDGKTGAEELVGKILSDPALMKSLSEKAKEVDDETTGGDNNAE
jgi:type VI secretion system protein ImpB